MVVDCGSREIEKIRARVGRLVSKATHCRAGVIDPTKSKTARIKSAGVNGYDVSIEWAEGSGL
jgi:hypothetical protein